jgi:hypothetical protein
MKAAISKVKLAGEVEKGKAKAKADRKAEDRKAKIANVKKTMSKPANKAKAAKVNMVFQSPMGGNITPEEIAKKIPAGVTDVYIRIDENKIYWVKKDETGTIEIW